MPRKPIIDDDKHQRAREAGARYRARNVGAAATRSKLYYANNREACIAKSSAWRRDNAAKHCANNAAFRKRLHERLAGRPRPKKCDICKTVGLVHFDHCHKNKHFRGWLCFGCNAALGGVKDSSKILRKLADYLDADKARDTKSLEKLPLYLERTGKRETYDNKELKKNAAKKKAK
jgi:hypothetical protein